MKKSKNIQTFIGFDSFYENAKVIAFGAPYDGTTSFRPGTRFAPAAIRIDSEGIETYSPYLDMDLEDYQTCDVGDLEYTTGNTARYLGYIEDFTREVVRDHKIPLMIGGEHLVTLPAVKAIYEKYENLYILHFDAHTDLREELYGEKISHATVIRRCWDILGDHKIFQFGIRSGEKAEFEWAQKHTHLTKFTTEGLEAALEIIKDQPVYVTIDLDILDPSIFPGTGTPEAGGITFKEMMKVIMQLKNLNIVGADMVELSPHYDVSGVSTAVACKVLRELTLAIHG